MLVAKVDNIDTSDFVLKTNYNTKITELENKIPDISNLATKTALTTLENKIASVSNLVKKADYNTKLTETENKLNHNHDQFHDHNHEFNKFSTTSDNSLTPILNYYGTQTRVKFTRSCLKQSKISYTHGKIVNIYIVYELVHLAQMIMILN